MDPQHFFINRGDSLTDEGEKERVFPGRITNANQSSSITRKVKLII